MPDNLPIASPIAMTPQTQAVSRTELDVASLPQQDGRFADYAYQLYSAPADLTVTLINYGERQPAAETVEIRLSRGIAGEERFSTTNGNALFSESGQILLLHDSFLLIVVETRSMSAWHFPVGERIFLVGAHWQGEQLYFSRLPYGRPSSEAETLGPLSLQEIIRECDLGVGRWSSRKPVAAPISAPSSARQAGNRRGRRAEKKPDAALLPVGLNEHLWNRLNFIEQNPTWVILGDGSVFAAKSDSLLPRQLGEHVVGGELQLFDETEPRKAAFIMDSTIGGVAAVYIKQDQQWRRIAEPLEWMRPYVNFAALGNSARDEDIH